MKTKLFLTVPVIFAALAVLALFPHALTGMGDVHLASQGLTIPTEREIAAILSNVMIDTRYSHALQEHPEDAPIVQECLAKKGAYMQFQIEPKRRYLRVCIVDEKAGLIGFQIVDIVNRVAKERTAYIKESIHNIRELLNYAERMGYPRFKGPL